MRLINASTLEQREFFDSQLPKYAILSHTWGDDEVSFQDFQAQRRRNCHGWDKIVDCCHLAQSEGLEWVWCDTCCIDKSSSAELSEAINSMFRWYEKAEICFAFIDDYDSNNASSSFQACRWFTRGWTLQELLAPSRVEFFDANRRHFGDRCTLATDIAQSTGIRDVFLTDPKSDETPCVAERMFWASQRNVTRVEDVAYCLLGIFGVNMPLLYGEGMAKAFARLQEEILSKDGDETIFAWTTEDTGLRGMLAEYPCEFARSGSVRRSNTLINGPLPITASRSVGLSKVRMEICRSLEHDLFCVPDPYSLELHIAAVLHSPQCQQQISVRLSRRSVYDGLWARTPSETHQTMDFVRGASSPFSMVDNWMWALSRSVIHLGQVQVALHRPRRMSDIDTLRNAEAYQMIAVNAAIQALTFGATSLATEMLNLAGDPKNLARLALVTLVFLPLLARFWWLCKQSLVSLVQFLSLCLGLKIFCGSMLDGYLPALVFAVISTIHLILEYGQQRRRRRREDVLSQA